MEKKLTHLMLHCTATPEGRPISVDAIRRMHLSPPPIGRGWKQVGYSDMIMLSGDLVNLVPYDDDSIVQVREITNGALGMNAFSKHIVYVGGMDKAYKNPKDTRTAKQLETMKNYILAFIKKHPDIKVCGHNQYDAKACPSFNVENYLRSIGVPEKNIDTKKPIVKL